MTLVWISVAGVVVVLIVIVVALLWFLVVPKISPEATISTNHHVVITGGSSGIGLALASECIAMANKHGIISTISLIARDMAKLQAIQKELESEITTSTTVTKIHIYALDVTDPTKCQDVAHRIVETSGPPTILFNNAGTSSACTFVDTPINEFSHLLHTNVLGCMYLTQAFLKSGRMPQGSTICMTCSMAGMLGLYGYTAYSASKYALRGYCEALHMELFGKVRVIVCMPPDTNTPGYELEMKHKPKVTAALSDSSGVWPSKVVAKKMVKASLSKNPPFTIHFGIEGWMLSHLSAGMGPVHHISDALTQILFMGLFRFISLFYLWDYQQIIKKYDDDDKEKNE